MSDNDEIADGPSWQIVPDHSHTNAVEFRYDGVLKLTATVYWEGCIDLWIDTDTDEIEDQWMHHICYPEAFIAQLQDVISMAQGYFGGEFNIAPLTDASVSKQIALFKQQQQENKA